VAANYDGVSVSFDGGYPGAERQKAVFAHADFGGTPSFDITVVRAEWNAEFARLTHRDVLGALTGLGVARDRLGDILVTAGAVRVLTDKKMTDFLLTEWTMIGAAHIRVEQDSIESITPREERTKEISATVASLRVDSVAAAGFGISRSRAASDIESEKLRMNWQPVKNSAQSVKEGDILSMRGRGRVEVVEVRGKTKKGRIGISLRRYL
jgi:RNA-binding protein YlmH